MTIAGESHAASWRAGTLTARDMHPVGATSSTIVAAGAPDTAFGPYARLKGTAEVRLKVEFDEPRRLKTSGSPKCRIQM